jgi:hypothetical protein
LALGGVISDGAGNYSNGEECSWVISGASPSVSFTSLLTEDCCDHVYVEECEDAACSSGVVRLATLSGSPALATYATTTTKQHLRVRFTSDFSGTDSGFTASWISGGVACAACEAGTYKATAGSGSCVACPSFSISAAGSDEQADCACDAGYTGPDGGACVVCFDCDSVVTFTATVAISRAEFTADKQDAYVVGVAQALSVAPTRVAIVSITDQSSRRRLLAASVAVSTEVTVALAALSAVFSASSHSPPCLASQPRH